MKRGSPLHLYTAICAKVGERWIHTRVFRVSEKAGKDKNQEAKRERINMWPEKDQRRTELVSW